MAINDRMLLDGIIEDRIQKSLPSSQKDEVFEYLAYQQILKDYDLSQEELLAGSVDGKDDGGIDAIYIFINGHLISDFSTIFLPKSNAQLEIYVITCKHKDSFQQQPINNLIASLAEFLNFSLDINHIKGSYNSDVLEKRAILINTYKKIAPILNSFNIHLIYACRGDTTQIGANILNRAEQTKELCRKYFSHCSIEFKFWGDEEILQAYRQQPKYSLELEFQECLTQGGQYVLLAKIKNYFHFITDEKGGLRKYLFDSNVRDFMGMNAVNEDILKTLSTSQNVDFWWLNNGITILCTGVTIVGKSISLENVQIVNGLQTSECIYRHFQQHPCQDERYVLIKVLTSQNNFIRDSIIRATNNQTNVDTSSLHATDKIQRDIEDILKKSDLFYERRTNYYTNLDVPNEKIFTPLYLASAYTALILKLPHRATSLKNRFMREKIQYARIFSSKINLNIWPKLAIIMKKTDQQLEKSKTKQNSSVDNYLKSIRYVVSLLTLGRLLKRLNFSVKELIDFDISQYTGAEIEYTWCNIQEFIPPVWKKSNWRRKKFVFDILNQAAAKFSIQDFEQIAHREDLPLNIRPHTTCKLDASFLDKVKSLLPRQPWPAGIHKQIAFQLSVSPKKTYQAIDALIQRNDFYIQRNGILYTKEGKEITLRD